ncbi:MAG: hypothetical protein NXI31_18580 [bacterium]|nr:hypothetical protein [bacterium]
MTVLACLATASLSALLPTLDAAPTSTPNDSRSWAAQDPQGGKPPILDNASLASLNKKLQAFLAAEAEYETTEETRARERASKKREKAKDAFRKDWTSKSKKGDLLSSMADLRAIYANCFKVDRPKKSAGTVHKFSVSFGEGADYEYSRYLPKKYKPNTPTRGVIVLPGTKTADDMSTWEEGRQYFAKVWPKKTPALARTVFHIPHMADGRDMDPAPDFSRQGQEQIEQTRIERVFGTYAQTMKNINVDRPRVFLDCGRGNCAFGVRFLSMFPDRFAGIVLRWPTELEEIRLGSLTGKSILLLKTADNGDVVDALKKKFETVTDQVTVLETTDAYPHPAAAIEIDQWFDKNSRNMVPKRVVIEPNHDRFNRAYWARIGRMNPVHTSAAADRPRLEVEANREENRIVVKATGIEDFVLLLNDDLVDLDKEFTVVVNDKAVTEQKKRSRRRMQRLMIERSDWEFLFPVQYRSSVPKAEPKKESGEKEPDEKR